MGAIVKNECLKKDLGLIEIFCIASGAMISSGLFILPAIAYSKTGSSVVLSYIIASILIIPTMLSKAELATAMPKAGGDYFFIDRSMGPMLGTIGGFSSWFSLAAKTAFALIGIGAFVKLFYPSFSDMNMKLIAIVFCLIFTAINLIGVKHAGKTQVILVGGLLSLLIIYVIVGFFFIHHSRYEPFAPYGFSSILATSGLVFVSFMGLTKVCSVAEEVKNPKRNIPIGMFLSWFIVSALYALVIFVTVGLLEHDQLTSTLMPISLGANQFIGEIGLIAMAIAAVLAFITTANAGLLSASRYPLAMSKDRILPGFFSKMSKRGTPVFSIFFTSAFMIFIVIFLDIEGLVKTASTLVLLLFIFINISIIMMRESKIRNYRPSFKSPFYPWIQIVGIVGYSLLIFEMGTLSIIFIGFFIIFALLWYWLFARDKIWREYTLLNVVERVTGQKSSGYLVDEELREILIKRDNLEEENFKNVIKNAKIIDIYKYMRPQKFNVFLAEELSEKLKLSKKKFYRLLLKKEKDSSIVLHPGIGIVSHIIKGRDKFEVLFIRSKMGMILSDNINPIHAFIVIIATPDKKSMYLHTLMWLIQIADETDFDKEWVNAKDVEELRKIILESWRKRSAI